MSHDPDDVVKVYSGSLVDVETYQEVLKDAGIESRVVGAALTSVFGNAIPDTVELWTHRGDAEKAVSAIEMFERESEEENHPEHAHPVDAQKPASVVHYRKEPYINPDPHGK